jgi:concanavalin A-like lectin/glucanase superfamily protein
MGGLVVGSGFPSFIGESEVGAPIVPTVGGFVKHRLDRTRFGPGLGDLRDQLMGFFPLLDDPYPAPLDLVTGRRQHLWSGTARLLNGQIQRGGADSYPLAPPAQLFVADFFGGHPGPTSTAGSISCWLKVQVDDTNLVPVFMIGPALTESVFMGFFNGTIAIGIQSVTFGLLDLLITTPKTLSTWHHVVWSADDAAGAWRVWFDGVEQALTPLAGANNGYWSGLLASLGIDTDMIVGRQADLGSNCGFNIHELGIWNRVLTQEEINQLYLHPDSIYARTRRATILDRYRMHPTGIGSSEAFGTPEAVHVLKPSGVASESAFGLAELVHTLRPTAIASLEALGLPELVHVLKPTAIASEEAHGTAELVHVLKFNGVASEEAHGLTELVHVLKVLGIDTAEALGLPELVHVLKPLAIDSSEALGIPSLALVISPSAIASAEAFGTPELVHLLKILGIASAEAFGLLVLRGPQVITALLARAKVGEVDLEAMAGGIFTVVSKTGQLFTIVRLGGPHGQATAGGITGEAGI